MRALLFAALLSGAAATVAEMIWIRRLGDILGDAPYAVPFVLSAFFLGIGLGAWLTGRFADRLRAPLRWFAGAELLCAAHALALPVLARWVETHSSQWLGPLGAGTAGLAARAALAFALVGPAALAMGATLPLLASAVIRAADETARKVSILYGINTLGAAFGAPLSTLVLVPFGGLTGAAMAAAGANIASAIISIAVSMPLAPAVALHPASASKVEISPWCVAALVTGFASIVLEIAATRVLGSYFQGTVYGFCWILSVYLACTAAGALFARRVLARRPDPSPILRLALLMAGLGITFSGVGLYGLGVAVESGRLVASRLLSPALQVAISVALLALPMLAFGAAFPLLAALEQQRLRRAGAARALGSVYLWNTAGTTAAPILAVFVIFPALEIGGALVIAAWALLATTAFIARTGILAVSMGCALAAVAVWLAPMGIRPGAMAASERLITYREGVQSSVAVVESDGHRVLKLGNSYRLGATRTEFAQHRQGVFPLLLNSVPRRALFIGLGTGSTAGAAAEHGLRDLEIAELVPELARTVSLFDRSSYGLSTKLARGSARLFLQDGRHHLRRGGEPFDVIVGDLYVPWRAAEGGALSREMFEAMRARLADGGIVCQWLPLYQLGPEELRIVTATFCDVFESVSAWWLYYNVEQPVIALVGSRRPWSLAAPRPASRAASEAGLSDPTEVAASWVAGDATLRTWSRGAPIETREKPILEFRSTAAAALGEAATAAASLEAVLSIREEALPAELVASFERAQAERCRAAHRAIGSFFRGGLRAVHGGDLAGGLHQMADGLAADPESAWLLWNLQQGAQELAQSGRQAELEALLARLREPWKDPARAPQGVQLLLEQLEKLRRNR